MTFSKFLLKIIFIKMDSRSEQYWALQYFQELLKEQSFGLGTFYSSLLGDRQHCLELRTFF